MIINDRSESQEVYIKVIYTSRIKSTLVFIKKKRKKDDDDNCKTIQMEK